MTSITTLRHPGESWDLTYLGKHRLHRSKKNTFLHTHLFVIPCRMNDSLAFEPISSATGRRDGWTPERQRDFILALARIGLVTAAAREVGMSRKSAYALLERAGPESGFAKAWDAAIAEGQDKARGTAIDRALNG